MYRPFSNFALSSFPNQPCRQHLAYWGRCFLIILLSVNSVPAYAVAASAVARSTEATAASQTLCWSLLKQYQVTTG